MRLIVLLSSLLVASSFSPTANFASKSRSVQNDVRCPVRVASSRKMGMTVAIPNPLKSLPWNVRKDQQRKARQMKIESAKLHRQLGIAEDATFEEISVATDGLIRKAEADGDAKRKVKVEIAKDRIMQIRLNERLAGLATVTKAAQAQSRIEEDEMEEEEDLFPEDKKREWRVPRFLEGIVVKPDAAYRNKQIKVYGILTLICFIVPPFTERIMMLNWMVAAGQIGRRGTTDTSSGDHNPYGKKSGPHMRTAVLLMISLW
eukprot:CAMPEP_0197823664 /NCGR_PEP_ID=MMETSP1437-20131217/992_1 /TAXON_ID=49252 ORGANISM="Eucampia antarctica, Strain CCMP1452" /NCGR_SAMPLE_ID=MMETSP1437 /ASSEMBLY_ACC=CAM_ASM_001096 /LENGTH=259 /DNA_ID=CAMNT_0043422947 /DNA_START=152 /DNA_END=928 /DNA_ORIENTATION=+